MVRPFRLSGPFNQIEVIQYSDGYQTHHHMALTAYHAHTNVALIAYHVGSSTSITLGLLLVRLFAVGCWLLASPPVRRRQRARQGGRSNAAPEKARAAWWGGPFDRLTGGMGHAMRRAGRRTEGSGHRASPPVRRRQRARPGGRSNAAPEKVRAAWWGWTV